MALPYQISGANNTGASGNLVLTINASFPVLAGDIILIVFSANDNVAATFPGGWTVLHDVTNTAGQRVQAAWLRAAGGEQGTNVTVTHPAGGSCIGVVAVYRGCKPTGSPVNASAAQGNASSVTCTAPTVTATVVPSLLLFAMASAASAFEVIPASNTVCGPMWQKDTPATRLNLNEVPVLHAVALGTSTGTFDTAGVNVGMNIVLEGDPAGTDSDQDNNPSVGTGYSKHGVGPINSGSGSNGIAIGIVVTVATDGVPAPPTSVIYNSNANDAVPAAGTPMVMLSEATFDTNVNMSIWYLVGVSSAVTVNFSAYFSKVMAFNMRGRLFVNVDQTTPFDPINLTEFDGASTSPAGTILNTNAANRVIGLLGTSGFAGAFTKDVAQTTQMAAATAPYANSGTVFNGAGPYRTGATGTSEPGNGDVTNSWTLGNAVPWHLVMLELRSDGLPPYVPPSYTSSCTLSTIQLRADHITNDDGVSGASALVPVGAVLGYCYAGQIDPPPTPVYRSDNRVIFFRTYDPITQLFGAPVVVEPAESYNDPAGLGNGEVVTGSFWDYPQLLKLTDGTLVCIWSRSGLGFDSQYFNPTDPTINGGGIFARESTDDGLTWSTRVDIAPVLMSLGPAATDGSDVWIWANQHDAALNAQRLAYLDHYDPPTFSMKLYKRSAAWAASTVYTAALSTRTIQGAGPYGDSHDDGLDIRCWPASAAYLDGTTGFVVGRRIGTSASSSPLTGPGTVPVGPSVASLVKLMCWRTTNGGTTWIESQVGTIDSTTMPGSSITIAARIKRTPGGRLYMSFKCAPSTLNIRHVTSSGAGNRTLTISAPNDATHVNFGSALISGALTGNAAFSPGTTLASSTSPEVGTASADLLSPIVDGTITVVGEVGMGWNYSRVFYSDDNGATWTNAGFITQTAQEYNPQAERTLNQWGVDGSTCITLDTDGIAYLATLSNGTANDDPGLRSFAVFKSTFSVDTDPTTFTYFGCFAMPDDVVYGGWKEASDEIFYGDGRCYVLEQFERAVTGREELWIMGYPVPVTVIPPEPPTPTVVYYPPLPFHRGALPTEPSGHPSGTPAVRRVGW